MLPVLYRAARQPSQCYRRSPLLANLSRTWRMTVRRCAKVLTGGIVGQRQVSSLASNVGLDVGATVGEADFAFGLDAWPAFAQHVIDHKYM